jgi:activator of HSP90 ATPase
MKKLASIFLSLVFVFSFAACGNSTSSSQSSSASNTQQSAQSSAGGTSKAAAESSANNADSSSESKTLVVYYSATPVEPYTSEDLDWTNSNSRVSVEHNDESKRDVASWVNGLGLQ